MVPSLPRCGRSRSLVHQRRIGTRENKGEFEKALELYQSALVIAEKVFGNDDPATENYRDNVDRATGKINSNDDY